jgi:PAS domain S-box-containing protein
LSEFLGLSNSESIAAIIRALCNDDNASTALMEAFSDSCDSLESSEVEEALDTLTREGVKFQDRPEVIALYHGLIQEKLAAAGLKVYPPGHPVRVYMEENILLRTLFAKLNRMAPITEPDRQSAANLIAELGKVELHYLRKENQLFPLLEKHGWDGPSNNMWPLHDEIRARLKEARRLLAEGTVEALNRCLGPLQSDMLRMISIEEGTLFPNAMGLLEEREWQQMREGDAEIGWMFAEAPVMFPPQSPEQSDVAADDYIHPSQLTEPSTLPDITAQMAHYDEGYMTPEQVNLLLKVLPLDITYVDENDRVIFYNRGEERTFPRSKNIIGREVRFCHPPKSVDTVLKILDEFKKGNQNVADFRIHVKGRYILIRYFAVRDAEGTYRGVVEMSQDITDIQTLEGEQRLLDWE